MATLVKGDVLAPGRRSTVNCNNVSACLGRKGTHRNRHGRHRHAAWDALAKARSAARSTARPRLRPMPAYADSAYHAATGESGSTGGCSETFGFRGVKAKIGFPDVKSDVAVIRAVRSPVGEQMPLMVDYNRVA